MSDTPQDRTPAGREAPSRAAAPAAKVSVAVFAYNEEGLIDQALDHLLACRDEAELVVHVLINGCTDRTEAIVRARAAAEPMLQPVVIRRGDKANAWNVYVHEVAPLDAAIHVLTDGDMAVLKGSISAFLRRFAEVPSADACAGWPESGRSRAALRRRIAQHGEMYGNLYALRGSWVAEVRRRSIRLPFGLFGEDGFVAALVKTHLDPRSDFDRARLTWAEDARFRFEELSPFNPHHWRIYRNRKMRYAVRWQQARMLWTLLHERGIEAMPGHVVDLYRQQQHLLTPRISGLDTVFDWVARRRIRRDIAASEQAKAEERAHLYS
jgi:glycosyltransferase involved in cell wall biosynthesis